MILISGFVYNIYTRKLINIYVYISKYIYNIYIIYIYIFIILFNTVYQGAGSEAAYVQRNCQIRPLRLAAILVGTSQRHKDPRRYLRYLNIDHRIDLKFLLKTIFGLKQG